MSYILQLPGKIYRRIKWKFFTPTKARISETSRCRDSLSRFCTGNGMDVGFGGDPIVPTAICMDLPKPYAKYLGHVQHLHGSADDLRWFKDDVLDWVYSSHVLEDFEDTLKVLNEWIRVVRPGGYVVLYLPDEQTYRAHCRSLGNPPNAHHIHETFGPDYLKSLIASRNDLAVVHERFPVGIYSFELVIQKLRSHER